MTLNLALNTWLKKVKLSIFDSSKCVYVKNLRGNLRKNLHIFSRFNPRVHLYVISPRSLTTITYHRRVAESFSGRMRFSKFRAGLRKYYMLNLISDLFKFPSYEYICKQ